MLVLLLFLLGPLLLYNAALAIAFYRWRKYPLLREGINFRRAHWKALFISCGLGIVSFGGVWALDLLSKHPDRRLVPELATSVIGDVAVFILIPLMSVAIVCAFLSALWCLTHLISALIAHLQSLKSKQS